MSQVLADFRVKYPEYDQYRDEQVITGLMGKFNHENGTSVSFEEFAGTIGYSRDPVPAPIVESAPELPSETQPVIEKLPEEKSMLELVGERVANWGSGAVERAGDIGGAFIETLGTVAGSGKDDIAGGFVWEDGDIIPSYLSPTEFAERDAPSIMRQGAKVLKDVNLGYQEKAGWQDVKDEFSKGGALSGSAYAKVLEYGLEQGIKSIPDMVAAVYAMPVYIFARSGEIGEQRAINKGKEKADVVDVLEAAPFAAASALLERIGAKGMTSGAKEELGKELIKAGVKEAAKRASKQGVKALSKEAATEAIQEGIIEYTGEKFGTKAAMDFKEALDRAAGAAVAGGVMGGTVGTTTASMNEINFSPEREVGKALLKEVKKTELPSAEQAALESLSPRKAQIKLEEVVKAEPVVAKEVKPEIKPVAKPKEPTVDEKPVIAEIPEKEIQADLPESETPIADADVFEVPKDYTSTDFADTQDINTLKTSIREGIMLLHGKKIDPEKRLQIEKSIKSSMGEIDSFKAEAKKQPDSVDLEHEGVKVSIPQIDKETVDQYNLATHIGKGRDLNKELSETAKAIVDDLKGSKHVLITPEQKSMATSLINNHLKLEADFNRWNSNQAAKSPSWKITGRSGRKVKGDPDAANRKSFEKIKAIEKSRANIKKTLYEMRPAEIKASQEKNKEFKNIASRVIDLSSLIKEGKKALHADSRKSYAPKLKASIDNALEYDRAGTIEFLEKLDKRLEDQGGIVKAVGPRSNLGKLTFELLREDVAAKEEDVSEPVKKEPVLAAKVPKVKVSEETKKQLIKHPEIKKKEKTYESPGSNYMGLHRSTGIPERVESVMIDGVKVKIPKKPQRVEPIKHAVINIIGRRLYEGKIKKKAEGFFVPITGEVRIKKKNDIEIIAHEMAHYLDHSSNKGVPNFKGLYQDKLYENEVMALSYTDTTKDLQRTEGFAEFLRLWLTNENQAKLRAPRFYKAFQEKLKTDKKLHRKMKNLQFMAHRYYFQGPDKLGQSKIGKDVSFAQKFDNWKYRRDSRIRSETIDMFHAARKIEQETTGKIGTVKESAWKQFRIAEGGSEGVADYVMNYGTVNFDENGDLKKTGKGLHEILKPLKTIKKKPEHSKDKKANLLMRYFAGSRASELQAQGRENLLAPETIEVWKGLGDTYPVFKEIHREYQEFNSRMLDMMQESGLVTEKTRDVVEKMNQNYVPFHRVREGLKEGTKATAGIKRLKGGTANLDDILANIQDSIVANTKAALQNRAKQRLFKYISESRDGALFASKIGADSAPVKVHQEEMAKKINDVLDDLGVKVEGDIDVSDPELLTFWQHGIKPKLNESGNIVDTVMVEGKPQYYEVQDPLLQDMLLAMNPESYSSFMNVMFGIKNFFTRSITLGVEFTGANLVRDTTGAAILSKENFIPFIDSFKGMYSFFAKDKHYQNFLKSGGGYSSRLEGQTKEGKARRRVKVDEFGVMSMPEKILSSIDHIASAFEYGTRIGEFKIAKKGNKTDMDAGFQSREISTDFSARGGNHFLAGYIRTIPFLNAMIQSQDRIFREAVISKKYDGNPIRLAMKAFLGVTVPTLLLYLVNKDDEDYKEIPEYEKRTNWHFKTDSGYVKIPRPYDVGFAFGTLPELFFKYIEDEKGKDLANGLIWTIGQMWGINGTPAAMTGWWDIVRNEKWTGAPVVPSSLANVEATEQYTSNTAETFIRLGEVTGLSPVKAEHLFKAYTGYLGGYLLWATEKMMWDEKKFGPMPEGKTSDNVFLRRFLAPEVRHSTAAMSKFFELKEESDKIMSTFKQKMDVRRSVRGKKPPSKFKSDPLWGLTGKEKEVLFALNKSMGKIITVIYGKRGLKTAELAIKYNKDLTAKQKRDKIENIWKQRNKIFLQFYNSADKALTKAKNQIKKGT